MNKTHNINFPILGKFALTIYFHTPQVKYKKLVYISIFLHAEKHNVLQIKEVPEGKKFGGQFKIICEYPRVYRKRIKLYH